MDILTLQGCLREILGRNGALELPVFPTFLARPWCHPDILLLMKKGARQGCFVFQPMQGTREIVSTQWTCPDLIWKTDFAVSDFYHNLLEFFENFAKRIAPDCPDLMFSLKAEERVANFRGERHCAWQLRFAGAECGSFFLFSEILGEELPRPVLILHLKLGRLALILQEDKSSCAPAWNSENALSDFPSLVSWKRRIDGFGKEAAALALQNLVEDSSVQNPSCGVATLLDAYCSFAETCDNDFLFSILAKPLNASFRKLASGDISQGDEVK